MAVEHDSIVNAEIHEPKDVSAAASGDVYVADGAGSGDWDAPTVIATGWRDMIMPFTASSAGTLNAPDFVQTQTDGAGSTGVYAYAFDKTSEEELFLTFHVDHDYKVGTAFYPHVHWAPSDATVGVVRWGIEWTYAIRDDTTPPAFPATQFTYMEQAASGTTLAHQIVEVGDPGITVPDASVDMLIIARIFRDATHANDTYAADAVGLFLDAHYQIDRYATPNRAPDFYA